ncbi:putative binding protein component of ABC iron transporter [Saliniradius amylolyticus]|uniref:Putative binding protein component of ABC iron transporter n=1 Tax=Saliniradius amylolyticus TaxID=2183582 RepID=A0A2S2E3W3_9ALTE|nr:Fe(3+) ABC transporter substrate-binding protein [Saliniradius amylolyticus]AWL12341.1 putative binding protein component of ABC iron transporter [Saliniradius amylolyticus]
MIKSRVLAFALSALTVLPSVAAEQVNVYSARKEALIKPVLERFTEQTGVEVNLITGKADTLISRIAAEGSLTPADVLITTDVGRLYRAKEQNLLQSVDSEVLKQHIPARLRGEDNQWFALTKRARTIMYAKDRVDPAELSTMEALTDDKWQGRICIRSSSNIYNQSMVAAMIEQKGEAETLAWAKGLVKNFARPPKGGDRDQIRAVAAGQCDIAIANTYYLAGMHVSDDPAQVEAAQKVAVFWPNQDERGVHVNISGAAVTRHSNNADNAQKLLEFLITPESQQWYARHNQEYPVRAGVEQSEVLKQFGDFKAESIPLEVVGKLNGEALTLMDKAGWK